VELRIGIAGLRRGVGFAKLFSARKDCRVVAVCDRNMERAQEAAALVGAEAYDDYDVFCNQPMDAIVVITPPPTHFECSVKALGAGKHVLCEIPTVVNFDEARQLVAKVKETGLKYMTAENVCYFPGIQKMHELVLAGKIGDVAMAEGEYVHDCRSMLFNRDDGLGGGNGKVPSWRGSFDPIRYSTHEIGPFLMILDDRIVSASCMEARFPVENNNGTIWMQAANFKTAAGRVIRELVSFSVAREPSHHFYSLYGTLGSIETDRYRWTTNLKTYFEGETAVEKMSDLETSLVHPDVPPEAVEGGHGTSEYFMIDDFVRSIRENTTPPLDVYKGLDMTLPGICAAASAQHGGKLIEVPHIR
jgi:predicted dehydrogenase